MIRNLLRFAGFRHVRKKPLRAALTVLGVALGVACLNLSQLGRGAAALGVIDFQVALLAMGTVTFLAALRFLALQRGAGSEVSGHGRASTA